MRDKPILSITVVTDDETGNYSIGDLDFKIPVSEWEDYWKGGDIEKLRKFNTAMCYLIHHGRLAWEEAFNKRHAGSEASAEAIDFDDCKEDSHRQMDGHVYTVPTEAEDK